MGLELLDVSHRFGRQVALENVSLSVRRGDCYGFLGHNGAGKTTAMRILLGLERPTRGHARVAGLDVRRHPKECRARVGGLIESPGFHGSWSGRDNLLALARLQGLSRSAARDEVGRLLEAVGLTIAAGRHVSGYSQGMRQRLGIAQALLGRPEYVVLDEPTNGLDPEGIAEIRELLRHWNREEGVTLLISSHQLHEIHGLCNRIGLLNRGRLLVEDETERLLEGGGGRYRLTVDDVTRAGAVLEPLVHGIVPEGPGRLRLLSDVAPSVLIKHLVEAGCGVESLTPVPISLEEIYLAHAGENAPARTSTAPPIEAAPQPEKRAPKASLARLLRYERTRFGLRPAIWTILLLPAACGALRLFARANDAARFEEQVAAGELISTTKITGYEAFGLALQVALPLAAALLAGIASQSVSGELQRGTLRNVVLRPVRRLEVALGKALALGLLTLGTCAALLAGCWAAAAWFFDFTDLVEVLPNGELFPLLEAKQVEAELWPILPAPILPLLAYGSFGLCVGTVLRSPATALGVTLFGVVAFDLGRAVAGSFDLEGWLPASYLPSPIEDRSAVHYFIQAAGGVSNAQRHFEDTAVWIPAAWVLVTCLLTIWALTRRSIR
ncbi:MAG: ATP-binding cassette domain-containing protein [Planctomycetota bacterium]